MNRFMLSTTSTLVVENKIYSSKELNNRVDAISSILATTDMDFCINRVVIYIDRSVDLIATLLFCLQNGLTFVPIEIGTPVERILSILGDCKPQIVFTCKKHEPIFEGITWCQIVDVTGNTKVQGGEWRQIQRESEIAYIYYTSGTTGTAKGVVNRRTSLENLISNFLELLQPYKSTVGFAPVSFDFFISDTIVPLFCGMTVYLTSEGERENPRLAAELIKNSKVDLIQITPSKLNQCILAYKGNEFLNKVKCIMIGGEQWSNTLLEYLRATTTAKIFNLYGPTEGCVWSTIADLTDSESVHAGKPLKNVHIKLLDVNVEDDCLKEIVICGSNVADGYLNDVQLTSDKFIWTGDDRCYKTGDVGLIRKDGNLEVRGRIDNQVKLRGHRVELEEIEFVAHDVAGVYSACAVIVDFPREGEKICLVYSSEQGEIIDENIIGILGKKLPAYMLPSKFIYMKTLPINKNGKTDRKSIKAYLHDMYDNKREKSEFVEDDEKQNSTIEDKVLNIVRECSDNRELKLEDTINRADIDSIQYVKIVIELEEGFEMTFEDEFLSPKTFNTIADMAKYIKVYKGGKYD